MPTLEAIGNEYKRSNTRTRGLVALHRSLTEGRPGRPQQHVADVLRATFVMGVAAFDALVTDLEEALLLNLLDAGPPPTGLTDLLWEDSRVSKRIIGDADPSAARMAAVRRILSRESSYQPDAVARVMQYCGVQYWEEMERLSQYSHLAESGSRRRLGAIGNRRNQIVHRSDVPPGKRAAQPINRKWVEESLSFLVDYGSATVLISRRVRDRARRQSRAAASRRATRRRRRRTSR